MALAETTTKIPHSVTDDYMAMLRRKRMMSGIMLAIFVVLPVSYTHLTLPTIYSV